MPDLFSSLGIGADLMKDSFVATTAERWMVVRVDELKPTAKTLYSGVSKQAAKWYAKGYNRRAVQSGADCKAIICRCQ